MRGGAVMPGRVTAMELPQAHAAGRIEGVNIVLRLTLVRDKFFKFVAWENWKKTENWKFRITEECQSFSVPLSDKMKKGAGHHQAASVVLIACWSFKPLEALGFRNTWKIDSNFKIYSTAISPGYCSSNIRTSHHTGDVTWLTATGLCGHVLRGGKTLDGEQSLCLWAGVSSWRQPAIGWQTMWFFAHL